MDPIRVVVADDHPIYRDGLRLVLCPQDGIQIVGEASTGAEAVSLAVELQPDVVVMDVRMPDLNGIEATRKIRSVDERVAVLMLTMFDDDESVFSAMRAGAKGYVLKGADRSEIVRAVQAVADGEVVFGPGVADRVLGYFLAMRGGPTLKPFSELTDREREVLELVAKGYSNQQVARRLVLSPKTVRNHVSNIFSKLQVADRAQAIVRAREAGLGGEDRTAGSAWPATGADRPYRTERPDRRDPGIDDSGQGDFRPRGPR